MKKTQKFNTLKQIQVNLLPGDLTMIARTTGYDRSHVGKVIKGEDSPNLAILNAAQSLLTTRSNKRTLQNA